MSDSENPPLVIGARDIARFRCVDIDKDPETGQVVETPIDLGAADVSTIDQLVWIRPTGGTEGAVVTYPLTRDITPGNTEYCWRRWGETDLGSLAGILRQRVRIVYTGGIDHYCENMYERVETL